MVEYYNLTGLSDNLGMISFIKSISELLNGWFGIMIIAAVFIIPLTVMIQKGKDLNNSVHVCSLFAGLVSILFYITSIVTTARPVIVFALTYAITLGVRWYNVNN